ncbi:MAG: hypothetical protein LBP40_02010 [Campylobacteraceae bacterium]|nr:hypothetical protein [Campylobacteraceae bacterium]
MKGVRISDFALKPRIECGFAGGKWENVENIIECTLLNAKIDVFVYDLR